MQSADDTSCAQNEMVHPCSYAPVGTTNDASTPSLTMGCNMAPPAHDVGVLGALASHVTIGARWAQGSPAS
jgi:hypothetical protein